LILEIQPDSRLDDQCAPENIVDTADQNRVNQIISNSNAAKWLVDNYLQNYLVGVATRLNNSFDQTLTALYDPAALPNQNKMDAFRESAGSICASKNVTKIDLIDIITPADKQEFYKTGKSSEGIKLPCPFIDSPNQRLQAGVFLYKQLSGWLSRKDPAQNEHDPLKILNELQQRTDNPNRFDLRLEARCFAADFVRARLNAFDRPAPKYEQIGSFMRLEIAGREIGDCQLLVFPSDSPPIDDLKYFLNRDSEVFSYTVTPKNLSENISTSAEVRDAYQMLVQHQFGTSENASVFAKTLRQQSEDIRAILEHPIIVGFGSGRQPLQSINSPDRKESSSTIQTMELGWIIAPHVRAGGELVQIDGQYPLTAVISVPSWWRSVELDIDTCWIPRTELESYARASTVLFCKEPAEKPGWTVIQLPGAIAEISRKLGFEVVQEPYITEPTLQHLKVGQPGRLIFTGGRLWRSTSVTLGSQIANRITVLPNMEGIIAYFKCVNFQSTPTPGPQSPSNQVFARVWTSEGVTDAAPVALEGADQCDLQSEAADETN